MEHLTNKTSNWIKTHALLASRLIALNKSPGVRPVGVGETTCRLFSKMTIDANGTEAAIAVGNKQSCIGSPNGIEAAVHTTNDMFKQNKNNNNFDVLLVDANNAFNTLNRKHILCTVRRR